MSFDHSLEELWLVDSSLLGKVKIKVVHVSRPNLIMLELHSQLVPKLSLLREELCFVSIVKVLEVLCYWADESHLCPLGEGVPHQTLPLHL